MLGKALVLAAAAGPACGVVLVGAALTAVGGTAVGGTAAGGSGAGSAAPWPGAGSGLGGSGFGGSGFGGFGPAAGGPAADIPPDMLELYRQAAGTCPGLPWDVLAGIGRVETDHGRSTALSSAGARGPMQFMPATWAEYGVDVDGTGHPDIDDPADAVFGAARMVCADGGASPGGVAAAVFAYNHSTTYVSQVLGWAATYAVVYGGPDGGGSPPPPGGP